MSFWAIYPLRQPLEPRIPANKNKGAVKGSSTRCLSLPVQLASTRCPPLSSFRGPIDTSKKGNRFERRANCPNGQKAPAMTPTGQQTPPIEGGRERDPLARPSGDRRSGSRYSSPGCVPAALSSARRLETSPCDDRSQYRGVIGPGVQAVCVLYRQAGLLMALHATGMPAWESHRRWSWPAASAA